MTGKCQKYQILMPGGDFVYKKRLIRSGRFAAGGEDHSSESVILFGSGTRPLASLVSGFVEFLESWRLHSRLCQGLLHFGSWRLPSLNNSAMHDVVSDTF